MAMPSPTPCPPRLRPRDAILDAFSKLAQERRYDAIRVADLVTAAGVGRTTFYEHFHGKADVLVAAMDPILHALAAAATGRAARAQLMAVVGHLWDRRSSARRIFSQSTAPLLQRDLERRIQINLERLAPGEPTARLMATGIAAAQIAMLRGWLGGDVTGSVDHITDGLLSWSRLIG